MGSRWIEGSAVRGVGAALLVLAGSLFFGAAADAAVRAETAEGAPPTRHFEVERSGWSKKVRFVETDGSTLVMKYKGIPVSRDSALNLLADRDIWAKEIHHVRYRFRLPLSDRPIVLRARAVSQSLRSVPIRSDDTAPRVLLFTGEDEEHPLGSLTYDWGSSVLFKGEIDGRGIEIERVSEPLAIEEGLLKYLVLPFPVTGDFVLRLDGKQAARFTQGRAHGSKSPYSLDLVTGDDTAERDDAMLGFLVFVLMRDFVEGAQS